MLLLGCFRRNRLEVERRHDERLRRSTRRPGSADVSVRRGPDLRPADGKLQEGQEALTQLPSNL